MDLPSSNCSRYLLHLKRCAVSVIAAANFLPRVCLAIEIWLASRLRLLLGPVTSQGGALSSQADSALVPGGTLAESTWPTCQVLSPLVAGAARCSRQNDNRCTRSAVDDENGTCAARRPQFWRQPDLNHHATQNSCPASLWGALCSSRRIGRVPPGCTVIVENSVSGPGLSMRATGALVLSAVRDGMLVCAVVTVLPPCASYCRVIALRRQC